MLRMSTNILAASVCLWLSGCATKTVQLDGTTLEDVQAAYEKALHPPAPSRAVGTLEDALKSLTDMSDVAKAVGEAYQRQSLLMLGIWSTSSEEPWRNNRYAVSDSTWWLILPIRIKSETAIVQKTATGTKFTLEVYPADDAAIEIRLGRLRNNLDTRARQ